MNKNSCSTLVLSMTIAAILGFSQSALAESNSKSTGRSYGVGHPFTLQQLPKGKLRDKLDKLPVRARNNAKKWLDNIHFHDKDLPFMRVDNNGGIYFEDTDVPLPENATASTLTVGTTASTIAPADAFKLHSKPGSAKVIYLDFTGHVVANTAWNSAGTSLTAVPYDLDGVPGSFSALEAANIAEIWRRVSEDYAPFDVDVTTEEPARFGPTVGRLLITSDVDANGQAMPGQGAGGVAYVGVWGRSDYSTLYSPAFVYYNRLGNGRPDYVSEAATHEMGHNLGLSHDATSTASYYGGHGTGFISWGPIMGTGYGRNVSQWSKGEYPDANQFQDDIAIISSKISYRADDHGNTRSTATPLLADAAGNVLSTTQVTNPFDYSKVNKGVISNVADVDVFSFTTTGGTVTLQATPARESLYTRGGNLDVLLSLYDSAGNLLTSSNPLDDTDAGVSMTLASGTYYLSVQGTGSANYSNYGSLGQYFIEGVLPVLKDTTAPTPNPMGWTLSPQATGRNSISMAAVTAVDDNTAVEYLFECVSGGVGCVNSTWQASSQYAIKGLAADTAYSFRVKARDGFGNETASSAAGAATTWANKAPVAMDDRGSVSNTTSLTLSVLANDSDPEGDVLTLSSVGQATNGTTSIVGGKVVYTPAAGYVGMDSFTYTITDAFGATATATVTVDVTAPVLVNRAPIAVADKATVVAGQSVTVPVLANDSDPEGDALTLRSVGLAARGVTGMDSTSGKVTYTPAAGFVGLDAFTYSIADAKGAVATSTVTVEVTAAPVVNRAPVALADKATVIAGQYVMIPVMANDSDPDGDALKLSGVSQAANGTTSISGTTATSPNVSGSAVIYKPASGYVGIDTFTYTITDTKGATATATVTVEVTAAPVVNRAPTAVADKASVLTGQTVIIPVLSNDTDPEGDALTIRSVSRALRGSATHDGQKITYRAGNRTGTDTFSYVVTDGKGNQATTTVTVYLTKGSSTKR